MGCTCSAYRGEEWRIQGFGWVTRGKETTWETQCIWEDNIKMDYHEVNVEVWTGSSWLKMGTGGGHL
jgi:hypothetical protein